MKPDKACEPPRACCVMMRMQPTVRRVTSGGDFAYVLHLVASGRIPSRLWLHIHINLNTPVPPPKKRTYTTCGENISRIYLQPLYCLLTYTIKFPDSKPISFSLMPDDINKFQPCFFRNSLENWRCQQKRLSDYYISGSDRTLTSPCESLDCASNADT